LASGLVGHGAIVAQWPQWAVAMHAIGD
jgi:hypothetical protein